MSDGIIEMIEPSFPALFTAPEILLLGSNEEANGYFIPFKLVISCRLDDIGQNGIFTRFPFFLECFIFCHKANRLVLEDSSVPVKEDAF